MSRRRVQQWRSGTTDRLIVGMHAAKPLLTAETSFPIDERLPCLEFSNTASLIFLSSDLVIYMQVTKANAVRDRNLLGI